MWYYIAINTNQLNLGCPMYCIKAEYKPGVREENIGLQHTRDLWHRPLADISNNVLVFPLMTGPTEPFTSAHC